MFNRNDQNPTVYSTEFGRMCERCGKPIQKCTCKKGKTANSAPTFKDGVIRIRLERKGRGGKAVSVIEGLSLNENALKELGKDLKKVCGTGGAVKDGVIEIQGDHRDKLVEVLKTKGYTAKKAGG